MGWSPVGTGGIEFRGTRKKGIFILLGVSGQRTFDSWAQERESDLTGGGDWESPAGLKGWEQENARKGREPSVPL